MTWLSQASGDMNIEELRAELEEAKAAFSYIATSLGGKITSREKLIAYARVYEAKMADAITRIEECSTSTTETSSSIRETP